MRKSVSPLFAVIVIVFAIIVGAISFTLRLRAWDAAEAREAAFLQAQADMQKQRSGGGRMGRAGRGMMRRGGSRQPAAPMPGRGTASASTKPGGPAPTSAKPGAGGAAPATPQPSGAGQKPAPTTRQPGK